MAAAALLAGLALGAPPAVAQQTVDPLLPDTTLHPDGRPRIVVLPAPGSPLVSLHVQVPLEEGPAEAGAGRLITELALQRARARAGPVSARIEGARTPGGIGYTVTGALEDFDYLTYLVRVALERPQPDRIDFQRARNRLMEEARRTAETPSGRLARMLRDRAFPDTPPLGGTLESLARVQPGTLDDVWARSHQASDLTLVVSGDLPLELVLLSPQAMGAPEGPRPEPRDERIASTAGGVTQVLRRWYGEAWVLPDARDPRGEVAAFLVAEHMRRASGSYEVRVELWELDGRRALAVMGAAYRAGESRMRSGVGAALRGTAESLGAASVEAAVARVRTELLFEARTPWGRTGMVGRHVAATGDPAAARAYVDRLDAITPESMRSWLADLASRSPVRAEVRP